MTIIEFDFGSDMGSCYNYYVMVDEDITTDQLIAIDEEFHKRTDDFISDGAAIEAAMEPFNYHYKILNPDFTIYAQE